MEMKKIIEPENIIYKSKTFYVFENGKYYRIADIWSRIKPIPVVSIMGEVQENSAYGAWFKISSSNNGGLFLTKRRMKYLKNTIALYYNNLAAAIERNSGKEMSVESMLNYLEGPRNYIRGRAFL